MAARPQRTTEYVTFPVDTRHWDHFIHRPDDIFVCTPPKCGTTWTQAICAMLVQGSADIEGRLTDISPWVDQTFVPLADTLAALESQTRRRVIKTHTPLDGIPYFEECTYIAVYRDPRDAFISQWNHVQNDLQLSKMFPNDLNEFFARAMGLPVTGGSGVSFFFHHYATFKAFEHLDNIHLFHYYELSRDLEHNVKRMAEALGIEPGTPLLRQIADAASFSKMQENFERYIPGAGSGDWADETRFLNKGTHGQWRGVLSGDNLAAYDAMMREQLPPEDIAWLQQGSS